jgi:hypothetical protein
VGGRLARLPARRGRPEDPHREDVPLLNIYLTGRRRISYWEAYSKVSTQRPEHRIWPGISLIVDLGWTDF